MASAYASTIPSDTVFFRPPCLEDLDAVTALEVRAARDFRGIPAHRYASFHDRKPGVSACFACLHVAPCRAAAIPLMRQPPGRSLPLG